MWNNLASLEQRAWSILLCDSGSYYYGCTNGVAIIESGLMNTGQINLGENQFMNYETNKQVFV